MNPKNSDLIEIKSKLSEYKMTVVRGEKINRNDTLKVDVNGGEIWLQPQADGYTVDITYINDTEDHPTGDDSTENKGTKFAGTRVMRHLIDYVHSEFDADTSYSIMNMRTDTINFKPLVD